ncbi:unnamed protein product [Albugo candida]|uniref:Uncharacterized protein n=1 Tax=Albugo candida TaxID=65357 RepID=A0A024GBE6_9STRA|nr:unnamed protein product [Albugo candida]|eukprot:CCI44088.1 unnamed protein product [Albugo candida]
MSSTVRRHVSSILCVCCASTLTTTKSSSFTHTFGSFMSISLSSLRPQLIYRTCLLLFYWPITVTWMMLLAEVQEAETMAWHALLKHASCFMVSFCCFSHNSKLIDPLIANVNTL